MRTANKIQSLRNAMHSAGIQACIVPSTDPHVSEYPAAHWENRKWISGFTGSAGTVVFTLHKAGLWTDNRYFLQAESQLQGSGIQLFKSGLPDTPSIQDWLAEELPEGSSVGIDGMVYPATEALDLDHFFTSRKIHLDTNFNPFPELWADRPEIPRNKLFILPERFSGSEASVKINQVLKEVHRLGGDTTLVASLDAVAWSFNIRGNDVLYNPVVVCYALISDKETVLFINTEKISKESFEYLNNEGVRIAEYNKIEEYIHRIPAGRKIVVNPAKINFQLYQAIPEHCKIIETSVHPVDQLKSKKNETEIKGFRQAMLKDGIAMVRFQYWLERALENDKTVTELDICKKLYEFRSLQEYFVGESFGSIVGYSDHGAIIHYSPTEESNAVIRKEGLLLVDSGAQYFDGTTDITRTYALGAVSQEMVKDYTLVLKGNINLAKAQFPKGTKGCQLDILARQYLWGNGTGYLHGTGHGVGCFLNVHEGPQSIRMEYNPTTIDLGMITSNEPGCYRTGEYGIRIENLLLTVLASETDFGTFYGFETITLCPIDKKPIDKSLLSTEEIIWLNSYHQKVYSTLSPFLTEEEKNWLIQKTDEL